MLMGVNYIIKIISSFAVHARSMLRFVCLTVNPLGMAVYMEKLRVSQNNMAFLSGSCANFLGRVMYSEQAETQYVIIWRVISVLVKKAPWKGQFCVDNKITCILSKHLLKYNV